MVYQLMILWVRNFGQTHLGGSFAGLGWAHSCSRNFLIYLWSAGIRWPHISVVRGYLGHVSFIIQQASLAHSCGGIRVTSAARRGKPRGPNTLHVSTCLIFAIIPLTKASSESVLQETNQGHGKRKRELLQTVQCNQTLFFFSPLGGWVCRFDLGDKARRVKNNSKISQRSFKIVHQCTIMNKYCVLGSVLEIEI